MKKQYTTGEAIIALEKNPNLAFNCVKGDGKGKISVVTSKWVDGGMVSRICWNGNFDSPLNICLGKDSLGWDLVEYPVDVMDAIKAYTIGKTVECKTSISLDGITTYKPNKFGLHPLVDALGNPITAEEILKGIWYIKEE